MEFSVLGQKVTEAIDFLETFPKPDSVVKVTMVCDEFTSLCPITGQPDFSTVIIQYLPKNLCIESKSMKLYLRHYREMGVFAEALSAEIAADVMRYTYADYVRVTLQQKARGGIAIEAVAELGVEI